MDSGSPHRPEPDLVIGNVLRDGGLVIPVWIVQFLMIHPSHNLETRTSLVLNHINWCTSHLLTRRVPFFRDHPRWLSLVSNGICAKGTHTKASMIRVGG